MKMCLLLKSSIYSLLFG